MPENRRRTIRGRSPELQQTAWLLRDNPTPGEVVLWDALRGRQAGGLRFRRQHPVGPFVLDFFCPACKLVVEVDGAVHDDRDQRERDAARTAQLIAIGYRVLRVRNEDVLTDLSAVLERIVAAATLPASRP